MSSPGDRTLVSFWHGNSISGIHMLCLRSWARHNKNNLLFCTKDVDNIPVGVEAKSAFEFSEISNSYEEKRISDNPSGFSNLFRSEMLKSLDAIWLDTDILVMNKDLAKYENYVFGYENDSTVNGAVLGMPVGTKVLHELSIEIKKHSGKRIIFGDLGPRMLTKIISRNGLLEQAWPISEFYEIRATEIWKLYSADEASAVKERLRDKNFVHLWNEGSKLAPFKLSDFAPQKGSFLYEIDVEFWESESKPSLGEDQINQWRKVLLVAEKRQAIAGLIPNPVRRILLTAMGRRISAGF